MVLSLLDKKRAASLPQWSFACQLSVFRSAKSSCMVPDAAMMCPQKMELTLEPRNPPSILRAILIWWTEVFHQ
jgi:hypothetical protein